MDLHTHHFACIELHPQDFDRYLPELKLVEGDALAGAQAYWQECLKNLNHLHQTHCHAAHLIGITSHMMDRLVVGLFELFHLEARKKTAALDVKFAVVAQGGYGREEMNIHSDVDLLFLCNKKKSPYVEYVTEKILYVLWDLGLEVGHATRTVQECRDLMFHDVTIMTSLLDIRYLAGDQGLFENCSKEIGKCIRIKSNQKKFIQKKLEEKKNRAVKHGGSVFVLEPNIKECNGGLRDLQHNLWIARLTGKGRTYEELKEAEILTDDEYKVLQQARNFLWRIRNELHLIVGKKIDVLTFDRQEKVAKKMGFSDEGGILAVERFMQSYYQMGYQVDAISNTLIRRLTLHESGIKRLIQKLQSKALDSSFKVVDGQIAVRSRELFKNDPAKMMSLFEWIQQTGLEPNLDTKDLLRMATLAIDDNYRSNSELIATFRKMLGQYKNLGQVLFAMHEVNFLDSWLPEFRKLRCRVQHDSYHIYTIDTHSIFAVNELSKLEAGDYRGKFDFYEKAMRAVMRPELLTLGLFVHDIGKGEGGNHSVVGAKIARQMTKRLGYTEEEQKTIDFLVLSHLMMPHLSQRRDLEDPELIIQFARSMETLDNLNMLFLLTWGDIRAVGPEAWTDWKGSLLTRLYEKAHAVISSGEFSKEKTFERVTRVKEALLQQLGDKFNRQEVERFLASLPPRYFFATTDTDFDDHFLMYKQSQKEDFVLRFENRPNEAHTHVFIYTLNAPQVFSLVTGVFSGFAMNILSADLFQTRDGHVLIVLRVTDAKSQPLPSDSNVFQSIKQAFQGVLFGQLKVDEIIAKRQVPDYLAKKTLQKAEGRIAVDNDVSAYYTVIDVYANDRLGLLYDLTKTLLAQGCYVDVSKISTKVEQVSDVFYVKDIFGHKITSKEKIKSIQRALLEVVNPPTPKPEVANVALA